MLEREMLGDLDLLEDDERRARETLRDLALLPEEERRELEGIY